MKFTLANTKLSLFKYSNFIFFEQNDAEHAKICEKINVKDILPEPK